MRRLALPAVLASAVLAAAVLAACGQDTLNKLPNQPPVAHPGADVAATTGATVHFDGSRSTDPDGTVVGYAWDFGDGATSKGAQVSHGFTAAGTYTVALTVTDDRGATGRATLTATVTDAPPPPPPPPVNQPPVAVLTGPATGLTGDTLTFDGTGSHDPDGQVVAWALDFGDGSTSATATATHAFAAPGTYTVTLTVTDDAGATGKATLDVAIADPPPVDYSGTWTWSLVDPSQANLGWACGTWQSSTLPITAAAPNISITEQAGGQNQGTYQGTLKGADFDVGNTQLTITQKIVGTFTSPTTFTGVYKIDPGLGTPCADRQVTGQKQ